VYGSQRALRDLHERVLDGVGACYETVLVPWLDANAEELGWFASVAARSQLEWCPDDEALCRLHAAARVNDVLLLCFQPPPGDPAEWRGPSLSPQEYVAFMTALGMRVVTRPAFHPFFHELVSVEAASDVHAPIEITSVRWPCLMLGELLLSRAGVAIRAGAARIVPQIAETSTLYWATRRAHRPASDLSHGWGSNSRWRTPLRRDFVAGSRLHFNAQGKWDLGAGGGTARGPADDELTIEERIELLVHRSFVRTAKPHADLWPFDDRLISADEP